MDGVSEFTALLQHQVGRSPVELMRAISREKLWTPIRMVYVRTRNYEGGLDVADYFLQVALAVPGADPKERDAWLMEFITFKLDMLDRLDRWREYLEFFEKMREELPLTMTYSPWRNDEDINPFVLREDGNTRYVHFLYLLNHRRKVVQRKYDRWRVGRPVDHQKHRPQADLTDQVIRDRINEIFRVLEITRKYQ